MSHARSEAGVRGNGQELSPQSVMWLGDKEPGALSACKCADKQTDSVHTEQLPCLSWSLLTQMLKLHIPRSTKSLGRLGTTLSYIRSSSLARVTPSVCGKARLSMSDLLTQHTMTKTLCAVCCALCVLSTYTVYCVPCTWY